MKTIHTSVHSTTMTNRPLVLKMDGAMIQFEDVNDEYLSLIEHMYPPVEVRNAATEIKNILFNQEKYACMHWRFEEAKCGWRSLYKYPLGLCMPSFEMNPCDKNGRCLLDRAFIRKFPVNTMAEAISDALKENNVTNLLLITDGHIRNQSKTVNSFASYFGNNIKSISGNVPREDLNRIYKDLKFQHDFVKEAAVERAVCSNADVVLASLVSSFSWEIFFNHARHDKEVLMTILSRSFRNKHRNGTYIDPGYRKKRL